MRPTRYIVDPLDPALKEREIKAVLLDMCAQEGCDGEPYDQIMEAVRYIDELENKVNSLKCIGKL